jgi:hypothetical protein
MMNAILMMPIHPLQIVQIDLGAILLQHYCTTPSRTARVKIVRLHVAGAGLLDVVVVPASTKAHPMMLASMTCQSRETVRQHSESKAS